MKYVACMLLFFHAQRHFFLNLSSCFFHKKVIQVRYCSLFMFITSCKNCNTFITLFFYLLSLLIKVWTSIYLSVCWKFFVINILRLLFISYMLSKFTLKYFLFKNVCLCQAIYVQDCTLDFLCIKTNRHF